jgi:uncharacterized membrane protein
MKKYLKAGIKATLSLLATIIAVFGIIIVVDDISKITIWGFPIIAFGIVIIFFGIVWIGFFDNFINNK